MNLSVRSKLALSSGITLLLLLLVFHIGSRFIFLRAFSKIEHDLMRAMPTVKRLLLQSINQLHTLAEEQAGYRETIDYLKNHESLTAPLYNAAMLRAYNLCVYALLDDDGKIIDSGRFDAAANAIVPISDSFARQIASDSPLVKFDVSVPSHLHRGMLRADEGGLIVAAATICEDSAQGGYRKIGVLVLGREAGGADFAGKVDAVLPGFTGNKPRILLDVSTQSSGLTKLSPEMLNDSVEMGGLIFWRKPFGKLEARMPVYDIFGNPAFFMIFSIPSSISANLAENTLATLTFMIACTGILFIIPLFLIQGRTVLNPLSKLTEELRPLGDGNIKGRRLEWKRQDEFGLVAKSIDDMLDGLENAFTQIEAGEKRHAALLDAISDIFYLVDNKGLIIDIHAKLGSRLGIEPNVFRGKPLCETGFTDEICNELKNKLNSIQTDDTPVMVGFSIFAPNKRPYWGELRITRLDAVQCLIIEEDISDKHNLEENRRQLADRLTQMQKMESLGVMARGVIHDFNNVLSAISGNLELLELLFPDDENVKNSADGIRQAIKQAAGLTRQIMAYAGKNELMAKPIDLNRLLDDLLPVVQTTLAQNASIEIKFAHDLRPIMGDANLLRQMAMNLLINASDALTGKIGKITLATYWMKANEADLAGALSETPVKPGTYAVLEVSDSGIGMDANTRSRIFDPFFSTKGGGRGLGLSAVWGIVKAHSGAICVRSTVGVGSSFQVLLPLNDEMQNKDNQTTKINRADQTDALLPLNGENKRGTILLVEDETEIRNQIARQLETDGFNVLQAADGKQAVSAFQQNGDDISLILLDVEMPEMNGEEALRIIRRESATVKAVVMSGYGLARVRDSFTHLEIAGMLAKPFTRAQLLSVLEEALRS